MDIARHRRSRRDDWRVELRQPSDDRSLRQTFSEPKAATTSHRCSISQRASCRRGGNAPKLRQEFLEGSDPDGEERLVGGAGLSDPAAAHPHPPRTPLRACSSVTCPRLTVTHRREEVIPRSSLQAAL